MGERKILEVGDRVRLTGAGPGSGALAVISKLTAPHVGEGSGLTYDCVARILPGGEEYALASEELEIVERSPTATTRRLYAVGDRVRFDYETRDGKLVELEGVVRRFTDPSVGLSGEVYDCIVAAPAPFWKGAQEIHVSTARLRR